MTAVLEVRERAAPQVIRLALDHLATALPTGARVIVFGSHADGSARADSDIDLLIIEPEVKDRVAEMIRLSTLLDRQYIDTQLFSNCYQPSPHVFVQQDAKCHTV